MEFNFDPELLKNQEDAALEEKKKLALMGGIGDALASQNSFGNYFLGHMNQKSNASSGLADKLSSTIADPMARQAKLYEAYKQAKEAQRLQEQDALTAADKDPNSNATKAARLIGQKMGIPGVENMNAYEIKQIMDPKKMLEIQAASQIDFDKQKKIRGIDHGYDMEKEREKLKSVANEKLAKEMADKKDRETEFGIARTPDDAKKIKDATELKKKLDSQISELIQLRKDKGAEVLDRDAVSRAKQLSKDLLLTKKNLESLGVLSQSDMAIVNEIIPEDPLQWNTSQIFGYDPTMVKLKSFKKDTDRDFQNKLNNRLENSGRNLPMPSNKPKSVTQNGHVFHLNEQTGEYE